MMSLANENNKKENECAVYRNMKTGMMRIEIKIGISPGCSSIYKMDRQ